MFRRITKTFFVLGNIVVAILFILSCYSHLFNQDKFWVLDLLTLGSFFLLLGVLFFLIFWLFAKPLLSFISVVALSICVAPLQNLFPLNFDNSFERKEQQAIRVMTWNVEHFKILEHKDHPEIKTEMLQLIQDYSPDIACFQEMVGSNAYSDAINYLPAMARSLDMPYMHYAYNPKLDFDGKHHFGLIIFSKWPIVNQQMVSTLPYDYNNIFHYVDIVKLGDTMRVFNLHLQSLELNPENLSYLEKPLEKEGRDLNKSIGVMRKLKTAFVKRKNQSDIIAKTVSESPYPTILCGDFNDVPNSYSYYTIGKNMQNAFAEKGFGLGRTFLSFSPTLRIDNVFYGPAFEALQYERPVKKLSDHLPVIVDLQLTN
jgi:endonuclease/exonuclease/phosphatase family metal-dependent hydrolase